MHSGKVGSSGLHEDSGMTYFMSSSSIHVCQYFSGKFGSVVIMLRCANQNLMLPFILIMFETDGTDFRPVFGKFWRKVRFSALGEVSLVS